MIRSGSARRAVANLPTYGPERFAWSLRALVATALCLAAGLSGCRRPDAAGTARRHTYVVAYCCDEYVLSPASGRTAQFLVFSPLMFAHRRTEENSPRLARRWEHSPDFRTWTFHLRTDVRWQDGKPLTARDVLFTARLLSHPAIGSIDPDAQTFEAPDDSTFVVRSRKPDDGGGWTWYVIYPEHLLKNLDPAKYASWEFWTHPVGSGPYRYVRHTPKTMMEFERNPEYFGPKPAIERVVLKFSGDAGLSELLSGNADALEEVSRAHALRLARDPRFRVYHTFLESVSQAIVWRNDHPFFNDVRVRRALTLALDRRALVLLLDLPPRTPVVDGFFTERQFSNGALPPALPYDTTRARQLLVEAGWRDTDGDGVLDRDGRRFHFVLQHPSNLYGSAQAAVFVQDQLRRIGVQVELQSMFGLPRQDYEAALTGYNAYFLGNVFSSRGGSHYDNPRMLKLADELRTSVDPANTDRVFEQMSEIFRADQPATPLFPMTATSAAHRRVKGLEDLFAADVVGEIENLRLEGN